MENIIFIMAFNILDLVLEYIDKLDLNDYFSNFKIDNDMNCLGSYNRFKATLKLNIKKIKEEYDDEVFGMKLVLFHEIGHIIQLKQINETNHKMNELLKLSMKKETEEDIKNYNKYHDYYIHEHNANMIAYNLLIDDAKTIYELNKIVNHYNNYIKEIYKEASPIEIMKKFKNIILDIDITNSEKLMYGFPIKKCLTK